MKSMGTHALCDSEVPCLLQQALLSYYGVICQQLLPHTSLALLLCSLGAWALERFQSYCRPASSPLALQPLTPTMIPVMLALKVGPTSEYTWAMSSRPLRPVVLHTFLAGLALQMT